MHSNNPYVFQLLGDIQPRSSATSLAMNPPLHVEVVQKRASRATKDHLKSAVHAFLSNYRSLTPGGSLRLDESEGAELREHVEAITFCDVEHPAGADVALPDTELVLHVFKLHEGGESDTMADGGSGEEVVVAEMWPLPAQALHGLWGSLVFESRLKEDTVRFVETAFLFAESGVDPDVVGWNRVVLLHGPPGTGKTSLCRALAHKLSVRLAERFPRARLLEINAHALFSKWFAESGKLVARLFERVHELAADPALLTVVLLDEVESLAHARRAALHGLEPSDAIRAVNALLTQLDRLRRCANVLVLTTSNVTGAIDPAFLDRADIARRVGPPTPAAAYEILRSCCAELAARGLVADGAARLFGVRALEGSQWAASAAADASLRLWAVARAAAEAQLSGRALRRLPFLASALHAARTPPPPPLPAFVGALHSALHQHLQDRTELLLDEGPSPAQPPGAQ